MSKQTMPDRAVDELAEIETAVEQQMRAEELLRLMLEEAQGAGR